MALNGWIIDKSAAARITSGTVAAQLVDISHQLFVCSMGRLEQQYSAQSGADYDRMTTRLNETFQKVECPADILDRSLSLQRDLAHHHGLWHRIAIPDLIIAETALHHGLGVVHIDSDYERIAEVRPLKVLRLKA